MTEWSVRGGTGSGSAGKAPVTAGVVIGAAVGVLVLCSVLSLGAGVAAADNESVVRGSPDLDLQIQDDEFEAGEDGTLNLFISNEGTVDRDSETHPEVAITRATEARSATVEVTADDDVPITVETGEQAIGTVESSDTAGPVGFDIEVADGAPPGTYELDVVLEYQDADPVRYTRGDDGDLAYDETVDDERDTREVEVQVLEQPDFEIAAVDHTVQIDESGTLSLTLENTGSAPVDDAIVTASAPDQDISLGSGGPASDRYVGEWGAGETVDLTYRATATDAAVTESYPIDVDVAYTDDGDDTETSLQTSLTPLARQQYVVENVSHDISIGDDGVLSVTVRNAGPLNVTNASVGLSANDQAISFEGSGASTETFVDSWGAGETKTLRVRTGVSDQAVQREYTLQATISARDGNDETLNSRSREFGLKPRPQQTYSVRDVDHDVVIGDDGVLDVTLRNDGPSDLRNATVSLGTNDPAITFGAADGGSTTTTSFVGEWPAGENETVSVRTAAGGEAIQRNYTLEATVTGRDDNDSTLDPRTREFGLEPLPPQRYVVEDVSHSVPIGDNGILSVTVRNEGPLTVTEASVTVTTNDQAIVFGSGGAGDAVQLDDVAFETGGGGAPSSEAFVGEWAPGETRTLRYQTGVTGDGLRRNYTIDLAVDARSQNDEVLATRERQFGFQPLAEQRFAVEPMASSLRVGEDGDLVGTITNTGERTARNVVVLYNAELQNVFARDSQYAIGDLEAGETAEFRFRIGVSEEAEPGPRLFEVQPRYRNTENESRLGDSQDVTASVEPQRDAFAFEAVNATFAAGSSGTLELDVENTLDQPVENVRIKLFPDAPLSSGDDEGFIPQLEPGESTTVVFDLAVDGGATPAAYPLELDVRYDDARGDRQLSGTYQQAIDVTESNDSGPPLLFVAAGLLLAVVGIGVVFRGRLAAAGATLTDTFKD